MNSWRIGNFFQKSTRCTRAWLKMHRIKNLIWAWLAIIWNKKRLKHSCHQSSVYYCSLFLFPFDPRLPFGNEINFSWIFNGPTKVWAKFCMLQFGTGMDKNGVVLRTFAASKPAQLGASISRWICLVCGRLAVFPSTWVWNLPVEINQCQSRKSLVPTAPG